MNLISKIFGARSPLKVPAHTVYLLPGGSMSLRAALETIAASNDQEFVTLNISHYSGYVREAAIGRAVELGGRLSLDSLAERVNDWVPEVGRAAKSALLTLLATVPAEHFVPIIPRLRGLMLATRTDHRSWLFDFERRLVEAGGAKAIVSAMTGSDFRLRRAAFFVAVDHKLLSLSETIKLGLNSGDIVLARSAVALLDLAPVSDRAKYIELAAASPLGPIRLAAFNHFSGDKSSADYEPFLWRATLDSQGSLRTAAARLLIEQGRDVFGHCTTLIDAGELTVRQVRAGLSLLAEQNAPKVVLMLARYAADARAGIRAHVVALQAKVSPSLKDEIASRALLDPSRQVRKAGVRLCARGAFVSLDLIQAVLIQHGDYRAALTVSARDKWDRLTCIALVTELHVPGETAYPDVKDAVKSWIADSTSLWTKPRGEHRVVLSNPDIQSRLLDLAEDQQPQLCARLREGDIAI